MSKSTLFDRLSELKTRFEGFFQDRKKIKAIENFSEVGIFDEKSSKLLYVVKDCIKNHFLDEVEAQFLNHVLEKHKVDYLDWSHKTKWLKKEMASVEESNKLPRKPRVIQTEFNFEKKKETRASL